jgi:predicted acylesterase/phospholipase RssA
MSEQLPPLPLSSSSLSSSSSSPTIKHLVISSGGPAGHMMYSVLRTLNIKGVWDMKDIKSIYGSSIGSYIAIILALRYEWEVMDDYLIKRPWEKIFVSSSSASSSSSAAAAAAAAASSIDVNDHLHLSGSSLADAKNKLGHIFQLYNTHGLYGLKEFTETLRPALQGKDMTTKITFQEFYDRTGIEVHFTVTEMNKWQAIDFSYKTHPTQSLVEACYMSCCYPFGFAPIYRDGCCYLDGGIVNDYPLHECIRDQKCGLGEILGVKVLWEKKPACLTEKSSLLQFIYTFFNQINSNFYENRATKAIPNEVVCVSKVFSIRDWMNWVKDENYRRELVLRGETFANVFLSYRRNFKDSEAEPAPTPTQTPTPTPTSILQPSASITSLTDLAQEMAAEATATAAAEATTEEAEATEPTTMM